MGTGLGPFLRLDAETAQPVADFLAEMFRGENRRSALCPPARPHPDSMEPHPARPGLPRRPRQCLQPRRNRDRGGVAPWRRRPISAPAPTTSAIPALRLRGQDHHRASCLCRRPRFHSAGRCRGGGGLVGACAVVTRDVAPAISSREIPPWKSERAPAAGPDQEIRKHPPP